MTENVGKEPQKPGPLAAALGRTAPFVDTAGLKDAAGNPINFTLYKGKLYPPFGTEYLENTEGPNMRPDDILVSGYMKTGAHWIWETMSMISVGKVEWPPLDKGEKAFIDLSSPKMYDDMPSPRILNTHHLFHMLPKQARELKTKIVLTTRNPKDTAVSLYHHHKNLQELYNYQGQFNDWFKLFSNGEVDYGDFFYYHVSWEKAILENPDHPIMVFPYENSKEDLPGTIKKLATFMEVTLTQAQVDDIANAVNFGAMKKHYESHAAGSELIRKGQVGDWKNWLTAEQSAELERKSEKYLKGTHFEPRFEI